MKPLPIILTLLLAPLTGLACECAHDSQPVTLATTAATPTASDEQPAGHPLKGVVVKVVAERSALLVKHEEIPGVMKAMTMLLKVDATALESVKADQAVTGILVKKDDGWWLLDVTPAQE
ncbi:MAG: copper-binding protein [Verrucomicrobiota bacterium]